MPASVPHFAVCSLLSLALAIGVTACTDESNDDGPQATQKTTGSPSRSPELPEREPDVTGLVGSGDEYSRSPYLVEPSDGYYLGMYLLGANPEVRDGAGDPMRAGELDAGDEVSIWIDGGCDESFPVQCGVVAVQVRN